MPAPKPNQTSTRRLRARRAALVAVVAVVLLVAACSSEKDSSPDTSTIAPATLSDYLVASLSLTAGEARCVIDRAQGSLDEQTMRGLIADPASASADRAAFDGVLSACSFTQTTGSSIARVEGQPFTYGDDAELDALWDRCSAEGTAVCDELYNRSPQNSEYEAFADTCGGRGPSRVACAPDALSGSAPPAGVRDPQNYGDSPELDALWDQCAGGDGQACIALEFQAPAGSAYAAFGASCGNRPDDQSCSG